MSSDAYLLDVFARHQIYIQRLSGGEYRRVEKFINKAIKEAKNKLVEATTEFQTIRYGEIIRSLEVSLQEIYDEMDGEWRINLNRFAIYEADFTANAINGAVASSASINTPDINVLTRAALNRPLKLKSKTHNVDSILKEYTKSKGKQIINEINLGLTMGESIQQIQQRLTGVQKLQKRQALTLSRTVTSHVMTEARNATYEANKDILEGFRVVATLDSRTSLICGPKDNQVYDWSAPKPPFHHNCRSTIAPVVKQEYNKSIKGYRPAKSASGKERLGADTKYENWLKRQPADFQRDVLGDARYELFRDGKVKLGDFIDQNDRILSLEELAQLEQLTLDL